MAPPAIKFPAYTVRRSAEKEKSKSDKRAADIAATARRADTMAEVSSPATRANNQTHPVNNQTPRLTTSRAKRNSTCPACEYNGHGANDCFRTNEAARERYLTANPEAREVCEKRVHQFNNPYCTSCGDYRHETAKCFLTNKRLCDQHIENNFHRSELKAIWERKVYEFEYRNAYGLPKY